MLSKQNQILNHWTLLLLSFSKNYFFKMLLRFSGSLGCLSPNIEAEPQAYEANFSAVFLIIPAAIFLVVLAFIVSFSPFLYFS